MMTTSTEGENDVSVTRCTDQSLIDNITSPGKSVSFDSASRLFIGQVAAGYLYIGDNVTQDLYELPNADPNGGEQVLVGAGKGVSRKRGHYSFVFLRDPRVTK